MCASVLPFLVIIFITRFFSLSHLVHLSFFLTFSSRWWCNTLLLSLCFFLSLLFFHFWLNRFTFPPFCNILMLCLQFYTYFSRILILPIHGFLGLNWAQKRSNKFKKYISLSIIYTSEMKMVPKRTIFHSENYFHFSPVLFSVDFCVCKANNNKNNQQKNINLCCRFFFMFAYCKTLSFFSFAKSFYFLLSHINVWF